MIEDDEGGGGKARVTPSMNSIGKFGTAEEIRDNIAFLEEGWG